MNVSMQDTFNLGWKLGLVCKKIVRREVLATYESERRLIAKQLIALDTKFSRLFSGRTANEIANAEGVTVEEFNRAVQLTRMVGFPFALPNKYMLPLLSPQKSDSSPPL